MKTAWRGFALAVCLTALCMSAGAQGGAFVLPLGEDRCVLMDGDGNALTQPEQYERIEPLTQGLFAASNMAQATRETRILDETGRVALENTFEDVYCTDGALYAVEGGLAGVLSARLEWVVPCAYTQLVSNGEGGYLALTSDPYDERPDGVYYVDPDGREMATGIRIQHGLAEFSEGMMPVMDAVSARMGYLSPAGAWAISAQYEYAGEFQGGVAEAALTAGSGFIDRMGNWLLTPKYATVDRSGGAGRLVLAQENSGEAVLISGEDFSEIKRFTGTDIYFSAYFDADLAVLYLDDCTQLIDREGSVLVECGLDASFDAWSAIDDRLLVRLGEWGEKSVWMMDLSGNRVAGPWQEAWYLGMDGEKALYAVSAYDVYEAVDVDAAWHTYEEVAGTRTIGVVDRDGREIVAARPMTALSMNEEGYLVYETERAAGAMDTQGHALCELPLAG